METKRRKTSRKASRDVGAQGKRDAGVHVDEVVLVKLCMWTSPVSANCGRRRPKLWFSMGKHNFFPCYLV